MGGLKLGVAALAGALLVAGSAMAMEGGPFKVFDVTDPQATIVDTASVTQSGGAGRMRTVEVFRDAQHIDGIAPFFFIVATEEIDCQGGRLRDTHLAALDKAGTEIWNGGEDPDAKWEVQEQGTLGAAKIQMVCKGVWPDGGATYGSVIDARGALYSGN